MQPLWLVSRNCRRLRCVLSACWAIRPHSERDVKSAIQVMRSNYEGPASILAELANRFADRGTGTLVGISSVAGLRGRATNYVYGSAKAALTAFLSGLRNRLASPRRSRCHRPARLCRHPHDRTYGLAGAADGTATRKSPRRSTVQQKKNTTLYTYGRCGVLLCLQ